MSLIPPVKRDDVVMRLAKTEANRIAETLRHVNAKLSECKELPITVDLPHPDVLKVTDEIERVYRAAGWRVKEIRKEEVTAGVISSLSYRDNPTVALIFE